MHQQIKINKLNHNKPFDTVGLMVKEILKQTSHIKIDCTYRLARDTMHRLITAA